VIEEKVAAEEGVGKYTD